MLKWVSKPLLLLSLLCVNTLTMAMPQNESELEPVTLQLKWLHQFQFAGYYAASEQGYYADEGMDVTIKPLADEHNIVDQVVNGVADYAVDDIGILASYADGAPIKALSAIFQHNALVFIAKKESGIIGPYEMAGKRIMFVGTAQNNAPLKAMLAKADISADDYISFEHEFGVEALVDDRVDAFAAYITGEPFVFQQQGIDINVISPQSYGIDLYGDLLFTSENELSQHPGRAERFRRASLKGWQYALDHPEELIQLIRSKYDSNSSVENLRYEAKETRKLILPDTIPLGNIDVNRLKLVADLYAGQDGSTALDEKALQRFIYAPSDLSLTDDESQWLAKHPVIRVGVDRDFAPYEWINEQGEYQGVAADYMSLLEGKLGVRFEIVANKPWHEIQAMAERGELDMLSCLNSTPERAQFLEFTAPYVKNPIVIITATLQSYVGSLNNLAGKTVAVERGYFTHENLANNYPDIQLIVVDSTKEALDLVATGRAYAYVGDAAYASYAIKEAGLLNLQFSGETKDSSAYRVGVNKSHPELLSLVTKALNNISQNERKEINNRWMGFTIDKGLSAETRFKIALIIVLFLSLLAYRWYRLRQSKNALQKSESRLNLIIDSFPVPCAIHDRSGTILYTNQSCVDTFGYSLEDVPTLEVWWQKAYPDSDYQSFVKTQWHNLLQDGSAGPNERVIRCFNGQTRYVIVRATAVTDLMDDINIVTFVDITERKKTEEALLLSGRVFNEANEGIIITDAKGDIVDVNPAFSKITGYSRSEVIGLNPKILNSGNQDADFYQKMWQQIHAEGYWQGEIWNRKKDGELFAELLSISTLLGEDGEVHNYLGLFSDITESKQQQQALEMMAHYDVLTALPNRSLLADRFAQAIAHSSRTNTLLAVCFLDLDNFKPVNDNYGHEIGDQLLVEVAARIQNNIRAEDTASRQGGDEFALLLGGLESLEQCQQMMDRIHHSLAQPYILKEQKHRISASSGLTLYPSDNADLDTLLRHADQAMYQAKLAGRNCYQVFNAEQDKKALQKQAYLNEIEYAMNNDELILHYQPKVNMRTGSVFGVEALIRWQHPEKGIIAPLDFLPAIENTTLEIQLGDWVINEALKQLAHWHQDNIELEMSVNISSNHLLSTGFINQLELVLDKYKAISSANFQIEILESSALSDIDAISNIINDCQQKLGISVALDDFGTGYSSLTHLRNLSANTIKIDRSFVRDLLDDPDDYSIIDGVISLASSFDRQVIAEGVETEQHGLMLLAMGCERAQGYEIARPMQAEELPNWLKNYQSKAQWAEWDNKKRTVQEQKIKLFRLTAEYRFKTFEETLMLALEAEKSDSLPILKTGCQSAWISRARHEQLFGEQWLDDLSELDEEMYQCASDLIIQYQQGETKQIETGLNQLRILYDQQQGLLTLGEEWQF